MKCALWEESCVVSEGKPRGRIGLENEENAKIMQYKDLKIVKRRGSTKRQGDQVVH